MKSGKNIVYLFMLIAAAVAGGRYANIGDAFTVTQNADIESSLMVHFIDVGQADSILCELPDGKAMLVDAGNNADGSLVVSYIREQGIDKIDYLVGTHPHEDHIGGMDDVIREFDIGEIYMPQASATTKTFEAVLDAVAEKGMKITAAKQGVMIDEGDGLAVEILSPIKEKYSGANEYSAVIMLTYGDTKFLLTGDMESCNEQEITADVNANVLKVAHHGSNTSSTEDFIKRVSPELAVISVGAGNSYGHPSQQTLDCLEKYGAKVLRTDENGTIIVYSDGEKIGYNTYGAQGGTLVEADSR